jgi:hypothetical protein
MKPAGATEKGWLLTRVGQAPLLAA